jgi:hypothetical protein
MLQGNLQPGLDPARDVADESKEAVSSLDLDDQRRRGGDLDLSHGRSISGASFGISDPIVSRLRPVSNDNRGEPMELDSVSLGVQENGVLDATNRCEV